MAKVVVEFDTVTKVATATLDGAAIENFSALDIYPRYMGDDWDPDDESTPQQFACAIRSCVEDDENKLTRMQTVYASEQSNIQTEMKNFFAR